MLRAGLFLTILSVGSGLAPVYGAASVVAGPVLTKAVPDPINNCPGAQPASASSFAQNDPLVVVWFALGGLTPADNVLVRFFDNNGSLLSSLDNTYPPVPSPGSFAFCPAFSPNGGAGVGQWTVRAYVNNQQLFALPFQITSATGGGGGVTLNLQTVLQQVNLAPGSYTSPTVLASAGLTIVANAPGTPGAAGTGTLRVEAVIPNEVHPPGTATEAFFFGPGVNSAALPNCTTLAWTGSGSLTGFTITRPGQRNGGSIPAWLMSAYSAGGGLLDTKFEGNLTTGGFSQPANFMSFTLSSATPIARVVFCSHNGSSTYNALPLSGSNSAGGGGGSCGPTAGNLIGNGSFELPGIAGPYLQLYANDSTATKITCWTVTSGSIDYVGSYWAASHGNYSLDMGGSTGPGTIAQTFATSPGTSYTVTVDVAGTPGDFRHLQASVGGPPITFPFDARFTTVSSMGWLTQSFNFCASSSSTTLQFSSGDPGDDGPALDNVRVAAGGTACSGGGGGGLTFTGTYVCMFGPFSSGPVTLTQTGTSLTGTLPNGGTVIGTVTVTTITITFIGTWTGNLGNGTITLTWDGTTLTGTWTRNTGNGDPGGAPATGPTGTVTGTKTGGGGGGGGNCGPTAGNLIGNGSFELPGGGSQLGLTGASAIPCWNITGGNVDYIRDLDYWLASDGHYSLDMDGTLAGTISQTFATTPGLYTVAYDLAGNFSGGPQLKQLQVSAAGQSKTEIFDITGKSSSNMGWLRKTFQFTANSSSTTLQFASLDPTVNSYGPALDNVCVAAGSTPCSNSGGGGGGSSVTLAAPPVFTNTPPPYPDCAPPARSTTFAPTDPRPYLVYGLTGLTVGQDLVGTVWTGPNGQPSTVYGGSTLAHFAKDCVNDYTFVPATAAPGTWTVKGILNGSTELFSLTVTVTAAGGGGGGGGPTPGGACRIDITPITPDKNTQVNLTNEGTADWYSMGLNYPPTGCQTAGTISGLSICTPALRKSVGSGLSNLTFYTSVPNRTGYVHIVGGGVSSSWNDGAPKQSGTEGGGTAIEDGGFRFTAPADQQQRTLMVHVGGIARDLNNPDWTLMAHIDGLPDQPVTRVMDKSGANDLTYKIVYQAPPGSDKITVSLQVNHAYDEVVFQAAALSLPVQGSSCSGTGGGGGGGGSGPTITLPPPSPPIGPGGGNGSVTATPPAGTTTVMAIPSVPWITIITVVGGTITYSVPPNPGDARIGVITISAPGAIPANVPVAQNGANAGTGAGGCTYPLQSNTLQTFDVNGKTPGGGSTGLVRFLTAQTCTWTATVVYPLGAATGWITVLPPGNSGVGNGAISFTVAVNATGNARMAAIVVQGQVTLILQDGGIAPPPPGTPVIASGGISNAASYASGGPPNGLAQGSFFSIFGTNLGPDQFVQAGYPIPTTLGGVSVQIISGGNTYNAYLVFVSAGQINGLIPSNVPIGNAQVTVTYNGKTSAFASIVVSATSFGVFFQAVNGNNLAVAQNVATATDYPLNLPTVPAKPGQIVILWGTGLGAFKGPDNLAPNVNDDRPNLQVSITVGGLPAQRLYAGRQAQSAGVDNIYFTLPAGVPLGCNVPLTITAGGVAANATTLAISADGSPCQ